MSLINFIKNYRKHKRVMFTTPSHGHERLRAPAGRVYQENHDGQRSFLQQNTQIEQDGFIPPESLNLLGRKVFECDYSEYDGFDCLGSPEGIIKSAQEKTADIFGAKASFFLINGASSGIIAAMLALLRKGDKVIAARNCHRAVYNGLVLSGAQPVWLMPEYNKDWGIYYGIDLMKLENLLHNNKDVKAVIITDPSYEGVNLTSCCISQNIKRICRKYNAALIIDEAHGALRQFEPLFGTPALKNGADIAVQSLHKTAGALNPSALLHIGAESKINPDDIQDALNLINTTSPSYPLLLNIEASVNFLASKSGAEYIKNYVNNLKECLENLKKLPGLEIYSQNNDISKILVKIKGLSGFELSEIMFDKYNIEDELANEKSVLYLTGIGTSRSKLKKLEKALYNISSVHAPGLETPSAAPFLIEPELIYTPAEIRACEYEIIDIDAAENRISMELIADCPPGIPILAPGELIKKEHIEYLKKSSCRSGKLLIKTAKPAV